MSEDSKAFAAIGVSVSGDVYHQEGMSLRDYFAIHADQPGAAEITQAAGYIYNVGQVWTDERTSIGTFNSWYDRLDPKERYRLYAKVRYEIADAMIGAREVKS